MKITLNIPDEVFETYEKQGVTPNKTYTPKEEIEARIVRFAGVSRHDRALIVQGDDRKKLEEFFQTTVETPERLLKFIKNMGMVKIGHVERVFTPDELLRLETQAKFHGWTSEKFIELTVNEALDYAFQRI